MRLELVTAPAAEPLLLADAKLHLRVSGNSEDVLITRLLKVARRKVEAHTRRVLIEQTWRLFRDDFCRPIVLIDLSPVKSIAQVKYVDASGALVVLAPTVYQLIKEAPARLELAYDQDWPTLRGDREGVQIDAVCGYGVDGSAVPDEFLQAMLLIVGHLYEHREDVSDFQLYEIPSNAADLLSPYVVAEF